MRRRRVGEQMRKRIEVSRRREEEEKGGGGANKKRRNTSWGSK